MPEAHIKRIFLGWDRPCLEMVAKRLIEAYGETDRVFGKTVNLEPLLLVLPGKRAARRLLEILVAHADTGRFLLVPPRIVTIGELPELLIPAPPLRTKPLAPALVQKLAWAHALRKLSPDEIKSFCTAPPGSDLQKASGDDMLQWIRLGEQCEKVWRELSNSLLSFQDVGIKAESLTTFCEEERWEFLSSLFEKYVAELQDAEFLDPQSEYVRVAVAKEAHCLSKIYLIGTSDLSPLFKTLLSSPKLTITSCIHAPEEMEDFFDEYGSLIKKKWLPHPLKLLDEQLFYGEDADAEAELIFKVVGKGDKDGKLPIYEFTIGYGDKSLLPSIEAEAEKRKIPVQTAVTKTMAQSAPHLFLRALVPLLTGKRFSSYAALVRHPDFEVWLKRAYFEKYEAEIADIASLFDKYHARHLPHFLDGHSLVKDDEREVLRRLNEIIHNLIEPLSSEQLVWSAFYEKLIALLASVFPNEERSESIEVKEAIIRLFEQGADIQGDLLPPMSGAASISLLLSLTGAAETPGTGGPDAVEVLGWLELQLDDAPVLAIVGMNEGSVPEAVTSDSFLPDSLRRHLGLKDNEARYIRDLYALTAMNESKELTLIAGRRSGTGEPLLLSRLLLADDASTVARRVARFYGESVTSGLREVRTSVADEAKKFPIPIRPSESRLLSALSVTAFADYLKCPYRFYLKHVCRLSKVDDRANEMDGSLYGQLAHNILRNFGESNLAHSTDEKEINKFLLDALYQDATERFGRSPVPAVVVQLRQLEERLSHFAAWQAHWVKDGWKIVRTEYSLTPPYSEIVVDGEPFILRGRIDRIDRHQDGRVTLFDYKTGEAINSVEKVHRKKGSEWIDLQLPLYAILSQKCGELDIQSAPQLGYIFLPKDGGDTKVSFAEWNDIDLSSAWATVETVVRKIRRQEYWPPAEAVGSFDDFGVLCGVGQLFEEEAEEL